MTKWLDETEMLAWRSLLHSSTHLLARLDAELRREHGLSLADYEIVSTLSEVPGHRLRMTDLAVRALISKSRLSYRVDRLEERELVVREASSEDARGAVAVLTAAGVAVVGEAAITHVKGVRRYLIDQLDPEEHAALAQSLGSVLEALDVTLP